MSTPAAVHTPSPDTDIATAARPAPGRACLALARVEAVRLARHPAVLAGIAAYLIPWGYSWANGGTAGRFPVLQDSDRGTQIRLLPLALATLLAANLATLRPVQNGTQALLDVLVLPPRHRAAAMLAALVPTGLIAVALVGARMAVLAAQPGASGSSNAFELACGPVMVLLFGALGVLLGGVLQSPAVAPLASVVLAVLVLASLLPGRLADSSAQWLLPLASRPDGSPPLPAGLLGRPAGWHLAYLVGLAALLVSAVLTVSRGRGAALGSAAAGGLALTVAAGVLQLRSPSNDLMMARSEATYQPASRQTCEHRGTLTYCAFPTFTPQIAGWDGVVHGILRRTPPEVMKQPWTIRQRVWAISGRSGGGLAPEVPAAQWRADDLRHGTPDAVPVATNWNDDDSVLGLAGQLAYRVVLGANVTAPTGATVVCQARGALMIWLAGQATARGRHGLDSRVSGSTGGVTIPTGGFDSGYDIPTRALTLGLRMLAQPADVIADRVLRSWPELTAAGTSFERVGALLGVEVPPADQDGVCP